MLTKKQFCIATIEKFAAKRGYMFNYEKAKEGERGPSIFIGHWIYESSRVAAAALYLDILDEDEAEYAETRGGIEKIYNDGDDSFILTTKELIDLLPEKINEGENNDSSPFNEG